MAPLTQTLQDDNSSDVRKAAAAALGNIGDVQAVDPLINALQDEKDFRSAVIEALGVLGDRRAVKPLCQVLEDTDWFVQLKAAEVLGALGDKRAVEPLCRVLLNTKHGEIHKTVATALGTLGDAQAVASLIRVLQESRKWHQRVNAVTALGMLGDKRAVAPLIQVLLYQPAWDWEEEVEKPGIFWEQVAASMQQDDIYPEIFLLQAVAEALGALGDECAVAPLILSLKSAVSIAEWQNDFESEEARDLWSFVERTQTALEKIGEFAVPALLQLLMRETGTIQGIAAWILGQIGDEKAVAPLLQVLREGQKEDLRAYAIKILGQIGNNKAVEPLVHMLQDPKGEVREAAAEALGAIGDPRATEHLLQSLHDRHYNVRKAASTALGALGDARTVALLCDALRDESEPIRYWASMTLGLIRDERAVMPLLEALQEGRISPSSTIEVLGRIGDRRAGEAIRQVLLNSHVSCEERAEAAKALDRLGWTPTNKIEQAYYFYAREEWEEMAMIGIPAIDLLIPSLEEVTEGGKVGIRANAVDALIMIGPPAIPPLVRALLDTNAPIREGAAVVLDKLGWKPADPTEKAYKLLVTAFATNKWEDAVQLGASVVIPLIHILQNPQYTGRDRARAAWVLGNIGDPQAVGPLIHAMEDEASLVSEAATEALEGLGEKALEPLLQVLQVESSKLRKRAIEALGAIGGVRVVSPLIHALRDVTSEVRMAAAEALTVIPDINVVTPLMAALRDEDASVRAKAAEALGKRGDKQTVESLVQTLQDNDKWVRRKAAEALGKIGEVQAINPLIKALGEPYNREAVVALAQIGPLAVDALLQALRADSRAMRWQAAEVLGEIGNRQSIDPLVKLLQDTDGMVRGAAARALGTMGAKLAVKSLIDALQDLDDNVRLCAVAALGKIGDTRARESLFQALKDPSESVQRAAREALAKLPGGI